MVVFGLELIHRAVSPYYNFQPMMTRAEVYKVSVCHYFSPRKSKELLGYIPIVSFDEGTERLVKYWVQREKEIEKKSKDNVSFFLAFLIISLLVYFFILLQ
jgi:hypothetical protein